MSDNKIDTNAIIQVRGVKQSFKVGTEVVPALRQADFTIKANSFSIIFGASGSGKSTLLNVLAGLQSPTTGSVNVEGNNIYELDSDELAHFRANRVGFMHQTNYWIKSLNVIENISVPLYFLGYSKSKAAKLAQIALDRVNMGNFAKKSPLVLSGGEQQRIGMARALANDPLFIIADEPTGNLDTANGDAIMKMLLNCQTEFRRTVILVTHNLEYISLADHLLRIQDGIVEDIPSSDTHHVMNVLLNDVQSRVKELREIKKHASQSI
jgi:putative ABC transport system ATP-binding protein